jgi:surfeit locus 1 family protein
MTKQRFFRFALWPTLFTVPAVLLMLAFSVWQLERLAWKEGLLDKLHTRTTAQPVSLAQLSGDPAQDEYRQVRLRGHFDHSHELDLIARSLNGNVGYQIVTPFVLEDGSGTVLVNRGWVPDDKRDPASRAQGQIAGTTEVVGILRQSQKPGWITPDNDPAKNVWLYVDVPAMLKAAGAAKAASPYWLAADATPNPGGLPIGGQTRIDLPNDHLQYAITWFAFAVTLIVIYLVYSRKLALKEQGKETS